MNRLETITEKIPRERTGLAGAVFVHMDYDHFTRQVVGFRISTKWKDGAAFDQVATALGDVLTEMVTAMKPSEPVA